MPKLLLTLGLVVTIFTGSFVYGQTLNITRTQVEVTYKQRGYLLALIPVTFNVTSIAHVDGRVELMYPWYSAITIDRRREVETELAVAVDTVLSESKVGSVQAAGESANPQFSAVQSAQVAYAMHAVLKSRLENSESMDDKVLE